jgi:hypothetical protein
VITPADLLAPKGPVEVTLFPGESVGSAPTVLDTRLQEYIDQADTKTIGIAFPQPDDAIRAWALYLTFDAAYVLAISRASMENTMVPVLGSESFSKDQRDGLKAKASSYLTTYQELFAAVPSEVAVSKGYTSGQTRIVYEY